MAKMTKKDVASLFPGRFYVADHAEQVFGFRPKEIPLPEYWKPKDYESHAEAGHILICYPNRLPNLEPLTLEAMAKNAIAKGSVSRDALWRKQFDEDGRIVLDWILQDPLLMHGTPRLGWQFVSPGTLDETAGRNHVGQTDVLIQYIERLLKDRQPAAFRDAKERWTEYERQVAKRLIAENEWKAASFFLSGCDITRLLREPVQNAFYRYLLGLCITGKTPFRNDWSRSFSVSADGYLFFFGVPLEGGAGARVGGDHPDDAASYLCAVASRSGF